MQRWRLPWIATGAALGCALTLGIQFSSEQLRAKKPQPENPRQPLTATVGIVGDPSMGSATAPVTIVEFSDFECPYCKRFHEETLPKLKQFYIDKGLVRFIHKDLPLPFHKNAKLASKAARCAMEDGKYWEAYKALFSQQNCLDCKGPIAITATTGINQSKLMRCVSNKRSEMTVNTNTSEAQLNDIRATPTFIIGPSREGLQIGEVIEGAIPWKQLKPSIDKALSESRKTD